MLLNLVHLWLCMKSTSSWRTRAVTLSILRLYHYAYKGEFYAVFSNKKHIVSHRSLGANPKQNLKYAIKKLYQVLSDFPLFKTNVTHIWSHLCGKWYSPLGVFLWTRASFTVTVVWASMARFLRPNIRSFISSQLRMSSDQVNWTTTFNYIIVMRLISNCRGVECRLKSIRITALPQTCRTTVCMCKHNIVTWWYGIAFCMDTFR